MKRYVQIWDHTGSTMFLFTCHLCLWRGCFCSSRFHSLWTSLPGAGTRCSKLQPITQPCPLHPACTQEKKMCFFFFFANAWRVISKNGQYWEHLELLDFLTKPHCCQIQNVSMTISRSLPTSPLKLCRHFSKASVHASSVSYDRTPKCLSWVLAHFCELTHLSLERTKGLESIYTFSLLPTLWSKKNSKFKILIHSKIDFLIAFCVQWMGRQKSLSYWSWHLSRWLRQRSFQLTS